MTFKDELRDAYAHGLVSHAAKEIERAKGSLLKQALEGKDAGTILVDWNVSAAVLKGLLSEGLIVVEGTTLMKQRCFSVNFDQLRPVE